MAGDSASFHPDRQVDPAMANLLQRHLRQVAEGGRALLQSLLDSASRVVAAQERDSRDPLRNHAQRESLALLKLHGPGMVQAFPGLLTKTFRANDGAVTLSSGGGKSETELRFDQLELMDDGQVQERLEEARTKQTLAVATDGSLVPLNALTSTLYGYATLTCGLLYFHIL